ncbi:hypothetical protein [Emcibacter sp. SYSU 3D8]|uniref:hypothetical protein n=1 Tax=Emcibacter sp. SYSU 3D8 TaxID=3133969 RepID=UPI0031FEEF68
MLARFSAPRAISDAVLFFFPASVLIIIVVVGMTLGKVDIIDSSHYLLHSNVVFDGVVPPNMPYDYAAYRPPFYSAVIAAAGKISGTYQIQIALLGNLAVALLALWMIFRSRLMAFGTVGKIVLVGLLFTNVWFFREMLALRETAWYALFCVLFVCLCQRLYASPLLGLALGSVTGLAMLLRPSGVVFAIAALIIGGGLWMTKTISARHLLLFLSSFLLISLLILAPWQMYLHAKFDRYEPTGSCTGGMNLFKGNHEMMGDIESAVDVDVAGQFLNDYADRHVRMLDEPASVCARDDFLKSEVMRGIKKRPVRFIKSVAASFTYFLAPSPMPLGSGDVSFDKNAQELKIISFHPRKITSFVSVFYYAGLFAAAIGGFLLTRRRKDEILWAAPVLLLFLGHAAVHAVTFPESRFRMPLEILLCVPAALAIQHLLANRTGSRT